MSNMIKAYAVKYRDDIKTLDITQREKDLDTIRRERLKAILGNDYVAELPEENVPEFTEGIVAPEIEVVDEDVREKIKEDLRQQIRDEILAELDDEAQAIIAEARKNADIIVNQANYDAGTIKEQAKKDGYNEGYYEGKKLLDGEIAQLKADYNIKVENIKEQYERQVSELEPAFVEVLTGFLEKLTGIAYDIHKEVLLYLVHQALAEDERSHRYIIRVSLSDMENAKLVLAYLQEEYEGKDVAFELIEDALLERTECIVETDSRVFDVSLSSQLAELVEEIRMLEV